jgi:hypothetical protein
MKATNRQIKSSIFGRWLSDVIETTSIIQDYSKLKGTGIEFHAFVFKEGMTILLPYSITPKIWKQFPAHDKGKYVTKLAGKTAFTFRVVDGVANSPVLQPEFCKFLEDNGKGDQIPRVFGYVSDWVNRKQEQFKVVRS